MMVLPPDPAASAYDDGHEYHAQQSEYDGHKDHPYGRAPIHGVVELGEWSDALHANQGEREVDGEDDEGDEEGEYGCEEGDDAHRVGLEK